MRFKDSYYVAIAGAILVCLAAPFRAVHLQLEPSAEVLVPIRPHDSTDVHSAPMTRLVRSTPAPIIQQMKSTSPRLWLHVDDISEGMANWRIAVVELLLVAKQIGAVLVEPCILEGRVTSCHKVRGKRVRLGDVFELKKLLEVHPWIISQEDYEASTANVDPSNVFVFCMHHGFPSPEAMCIRGGKRLTNFYESTFNIVLEQALQQQEPSVIEIHTYRKGGFAKTKLNPGTQKLVDATLVQRVMENNLDFHSKHYDQVSEFLQKLGIGDEYNVIHWRAELPNINYPNCAEKLVNAKNIMSNNSTPTILISSLNQIPYYQWGGGVFARKGSALTLKSLMDDHGFLKLDTIKDKPTDDMIYLAVWDQILSQNATTFATCTKTCKAKQSCKACNYQGSFGEVVMGLRKRFGRQSLSCWPTKG